MAVDPTTTVSVRTIAELLELVPAPVTALRSDGLSSIANGPYLSLFGIEADQLSDRDLGQVMHPEDLESAWAVLQTQTADTSIGPLDLRVRHNDGDYVRCTWMVRLDSATGWLFAAAMDVTERHARQDELLTEARTDQLTGVANRSGLMHALKRSFDEDERRLVAVVDLDRFKIVNDTFGHAVGDEVLGVVADRLRRSTPAGTVVSRSGGDEFVLLIRDPDVTVAELGPILTRVITDPIILGPRLIAISGSVGMARGDNATDVTDLLQQADFALYEAKQQHGGSWVLADDRLVARRRREMDLEQRMRAAIGTGQFQPWFQPIVDVDTARPVAYESLMRWVRPNGAIVPAYEFIELATDVGLVASIGREIAGQTLEFAAALPGHRIAINLSPAELADERWLDHVVNQIDLHKVDRRAIVFEVTETSLIQDLETARRRLRRLADQGFFISLDDFGSGYSSLTYLTTLPIHSVKLDRMLLASRRNSVQSRRTFEAIVRFVQELDYSMIVEGVEDADDHDYIRNLGVKQAQGWHYGKAIPATNILRASADAAALQRSPANAADDATMADLSAGHLHVAPSQVSDTVTG